MKLPEKVRAGEKLSARWLNQMVDCLKELAKATSLDGNGTSTSSISYSGSDMRDAKYRGTGGMDLQEYKVFPFQLRLKPKQLCKVADDGSWEKIAQMKAGAIIDYFGNTRAVPEDEVIYSYSDGWVDIGHFSNVAQSVYCIIRQNYNGEIISAKIEKKEQKFVPWGKTEANPTGEGVLSVFIGSYQLLMIEEVNRAHIYQAHIGALDLQTVQVEKMVDVKASVGYGSGNGNGNGDGNYYTGTASNEYMSKPACLFYQRDMHLFVFKRLVCGEGLDLADDKNLTITLRRANSVWSGTLGSASPVGSDAPVITLGGVDDIVFDSDILRPVLDNGIIRIPYADTLKEVTGVISGLVVRYAPAVLNADGTVTFLEGQGSCQYSSPSAESDGSGSASADYHNQIVEGVIYITIPIFQECSGSPSLSASASASYSASDSASASMSASASASDSASASASGSASASASGSASASACDSASASEPDGSTPAGSTPEGSTPGGSTPDGSTPGGSTPGGSTPGGSTPGGSHPGSSGSTGSACCGCNCAAKLAEMQARIEALEKRIEELETAQCSCQCGDLLSQIQTAIEAEARAIVEGLNYEISVNGVTVTSTEYGTVSADTTGSLTGDGGNANSNIHY